MTPTLLPATLLLLLLLFPAPCGLTALPIEPALFLNVGSPAAIQAAFMGRPWSGGEVPVVLVYNTSDPCKEDFTQSLRAALGPVLNATLRVTCVPLLEASVGPAAEGLFLLVLPVADSAALALPMAQLLFNVSHAARAAAIALSSGPPPRPARPCDAQCPDVSGLLHFPYIAQYYRVPYLHATQQGPALPEAVAQYWAAALTAPPEAALRPPTAYFDKPHRHGEPREYVSAFPSHLYLRLRGLPAPAPPPGAAGLVYHGHHHLHRLAHALRGAKVSRKPLTVAAIGSSFTFGVGLKDLRKQTYCTLLGKALHDMGVPATVLNLGRRGGTPTTFAVCGPRCVPAATDVLLLEFAVSSKKPPLTALEDLLRRFSASAIVFVGVFQQYKRYWQANDNVNFALAHHYGVPFLSMRSVAYHSDAATSRFFKGASGHHFGPYGHRMVAASLADLFRFAVAHVSTPPPVTPHLPPPWWSSQSSGREAQYWEHDELAVVASDGWALHNGTRPGWVATHL
eukprot:EG_transcript_10126